MTVQDMLEIACRHETPMSDAMVAACVAWAVETGNRLERPDSDKGGEESR